MKTDRILIVGGGASGVILAAHLLKCGPDTLNVALVERRPSFGAGIAYSTDEPDHLLNTRASGTGGSAFGNGAWATGEYSTALGHNSYADGDDSDSQAPRHRALSRAGCAS